MKLIETLKDILRSITVVRSDMHIFYFDLTKVLKLSRRSALRRESTQISQKHVIALDFSVMDKEVFNGSISYLTVYRSKQEICIVSKLK